MNHLRYSTFPLVWRCSLLGVLLSLLAITELPAAPPSITPFMLEDYSDPKRNKSGAERLLFDDKSAGSKSTATQEFEKGCLKAKGQLEPGRGAPAFISIVSPLLPDGKPKDMTGYQGIRLRVKVLKGILCVQVATSEIQNFDYHTSAPISGKNGEFQEVRITFKELKRSWSEQVALNSKTIISINLVSFSMAKDTFAYEVDELGFY